MRQHREGSTIHIRVIGHNKSTEENGHRDFETINQTTLVNGRRFTLMTVSPFLSGPVLHASDGTQSSAAWPSIDGPMTFPQERLQTHKEESNGSDCHYWHLHVIGYRYPSWSTGVVQKDGSRNASSVFLPSCPEYLRILTRQEDNVLLGLEEHLGDKGKCSIMYNRHSTRTTLLWSTSRTRLNFMKEIPKKRVDGASSPTDPRTQSFLPFNTFPVMWGRNGQMKSVKGYQLKEVDHLP